MASRVSRQAFSTTARAARLGRSNVHPPRRFMSASADAAAHHEPFKPSSDLPWIIGAAVITIPTLGYLLKDTMAIKARSAAGHHGHDSHDSHDSHAAPAVMKDSEGTEADVSSSVNQATATDAPKAADATTEKAASEETAPADAAAEPPKDEKESGDEQKEASQK